MRLILFATAASVVFAPSALVAQTAAGGRHRLSISVGRGSADERDESVSPLRYSGGGLGVGLEYGFEPSRSRTTFGLSLVTADLDRVRSASQQSRGDHARLAATLASVYRLRGFGAERRRLLAGAILDGTIAAREQRFETANRSYRDVVIAAAPALRLEIDPRPHSTIAYTVSVPLVTGLVRSYSDVHLLRDAHERRLRWSGPASFRSLRQTLTYTGKTGKHWGIRAGAHVEQFDYELDPRLAGARTFVNVGLLWWTRSSR